MTRWNWFTSILLVALCHVALAADAPPTTKPSDKSPGQQQRPPESVTTPMRTQQLQGADVFFYIEAETTFASLRQTIDQLMAPLTEAINGGKVQPTGPVIFVYTGVAGDMSKPFKLQVGIPVAGGAVEAGQFKTRALPSIRAATMIFSGSLLDIPQAYRRLYSELFASGLTPAGENRERYLHWEGADSNNNVVLIEVAVR
jgi:effector-binding domain-containing protein